MACNIFLKLPGNIKMPALGIGTVESPGDDIETAIDVALETGYRHIDTAQMYGTEEAIGNVLSRWLESGRLKREEIFITTKLAMASMHPDNVEERLKESLEKLKLDYVDLYLIHFPISIVDMQTDPHGDPNVDYVDVWKKMEEQRDSGRAKSIGVSNFSIKKLERLLKTCRIKPANNQVEMHIYFQQKELVDFCTKHGITVVAYSPLGTRGFNTIAEKYGIEKIELPDLLNDEVVMEVAKKHSKTPAQILLRFLMQLGVAPIPKSANPDRIRQNFDVFNFSLDEQDMKSLRALDKGPAARISNFSFWKITDHPYYEF